MADLLFWGVVFVVSMAVLVKSSDVFTIAAERLGVLFRLSPFIVGVTVVAVGTSLPELVSSLIATLAGASEVVAANVTGSNIANILLIMGVAVLVARRPLACNFNRADVPALLGSALLFAFFIRDGLFSLGEGVLFLALLAVYFYHTVRVEGVGVDAEIEREMRGFRLAKGSVPLAVVLLLSAAFIYLGAHFTVRSVVEVAGLLGVGADIIAVTAIALGTSLPELAVSVTAARKGKPEIAVGNVLGSNIFNILGVMGASALVAPLLVTPAVTLLSMPVMLLATLLYVAAARLRHVRRMMGVAFIACYALFLVALLLIF